MGRNEKIWAGGAGTACWCAICYVFYHSLLPGILTSWLFLLFFMPAMEKRREKKRRIALRNQFGEVAQSLSGLLLAGYSAENAMVKALEQQREMGREKSELFPVLEAMCRQLTLGVPLERLWEEYGTQCGVEEINEFSRAFSLARRTGASLPGILNRVTVQLGISIQTENQIDTLLSGKRLEQRIMLLMPAAILLFVSLTSPDMLSVMYETWQGRGLMSVFLAIYVGAFCLALKMGG